MRITDLYTLLFNITCVRFNIKLFDRIILIERIFGQIFFSSTLFNFFLCKFMYVFMLNVKILTIKRLVLQFTVAS